MIRDELASFVTEVSFESIPGSVVIEVKRLLLDHVASMLAGPRVVRGRATSPAGASPSAGWNCGVEHHWRAGTLSVY